MEKQTHKNGFIMMLCFLLSLVLLALSSLVLGRGYGQTVTTQTTPRTLPTIVIDAGHGGEDGGASSTSGIQEKEVNLVVATILRDLLEANGIPTVMTRTTDVLLYDRNTNYQGHKKALDLAARASIAKQTTNCIFVSIHMNAFPAQQYSGLQVWYAPTDPQSQALAQAIQTTAASLSPDNHRKIKVAGSNIYLLHEVTYPAVLVECGFLSNPTEAEKLSDPTYQKALAFVIFSAICKHISA